MVSQIIPGRLIMVSNSSIKTLTGYSDESQNGFGCKSIPPSQSPTLVAYFGGC